MKRLTLLLLVLLTTTLPVWAVDETLQAQFLRVLFSRPEGEWPELLTQNVRVLDATFFERADARIRWDLENNQVEDGLRFALVSDLASAAVGRTGRYRLSLAEAFYKAGNFQIAKDLVDSILLRSPGDHETKAFLAHMLRNMNDYFPAWTIYDELQKAGYKKSACLLEMAIIDLKQAQEERARQELQEVLRIDSSSQAAKDLLAQLDAPLHWAPPIKGGGTPSGNTTTTTVAASNPGAGAKWFALAEENYKAGNLEAAATNYLKSIEADPSHVKSYVYLGALYYRQGGPSLDLAITNLNQAITLDPSDVEGWRFLGNCYERRFDTKGNKSDLEQAVACFQKGQTLAPQDKTIKGELDRVLDKKNPSAGL